jgi:uncharacterized membrane protein YjgN (DUF898 family)
VTDTPQAPPPPPPYAQPVYAAPAPNHPAAVPALVLGILSVLACGLFTGIPAIVMGRRATREIRADRARFSGEGMAQAGFWTGIAGTVLSVLAVLLIVGLFAVGGAVHGEFQQTCRVVGGGDQQHQRVQADCR